MVTWGDADYGSDSADVQDFLVDVMRIQAERTFGICQRNSRGVCIYVYIVRYISTYTYVYTHVCVYVCMNVWYVM